jgi:peptidoglycan/LPS O-acetylase OafA/YrhL
MQHSAPNLSNLTALRGITALLVAVYHFEDLAVRFLPQASSMFFSKCYLMVDIFFIMSGFIITHVYQETFCRGVSANSFKRFVAARFARIYPMHLFALLVVLLSFLASGAEPDVIQDPAAIFSNLLLIHSFGIHDSFTWNVPSWSISAEWWSYMLFPFLVMAIDKWKTIAIPLLFLTATVAYLAMMYWLPRSGVFYPPGIPVPQDLNLTFDYGYLRGISGFMVGMVLYKLYESKAAQVVFGSDGVFGVLAACTVVGLHFAVPDIAMIPVFAGLVISTACNKGAIHRLFQSRPLQFIGEISYSIYMLHVIIIFAALEILGSFGIVLAGGETKLVDFWPGLLGCIAFLAVVLALSAVSFAKLEKPCRDYLNRKAILTPSK